MRRVTGFVVMVSARRSWRDIHQRGLRAAVQARVHRVTSVTWALADDTNGDGAGR